MDDKFWEIILGILGLAGLIGAIIKGVMRSKLNLFITIILTIYFIDVLFLDLDHRYSIFIPVCILLIYVCLLFAFPDLFDSKKRLEGKAVLEAVFEEFFNVIQSQGVEGCNTLEIFGKIYCKRNKFVTFYCEEMIKILIDRVYKWSGVYYINNTEEKQIESDIENEELGYLASAAIISIANLSVSNKNKQGKKFIEEDIEHIPPINNTKEDDIIMLAIPVAQEIVTLNKTNYETYQENGYIVKIRKKTKEILNEFIPDRKLKQKIESEIERKIFKKMF